MSLGMSDIYKPKGKNDNTKVICKTSSYCYKSNNLNNST